MGKKGGGDMILEERLDRALVNGGFLNFFLNVRLLNLIAASSNHTPNFL